MMIRRHLSNIFNFVSSDRKYLKAIQKSSDCFQYCNMKPLSFPKSYSSEKSHIEQREKWNNSRCMSHVCVYVTWMLWKLSTRDASDCFFLLHWKAPNFSDIYLRVLSSIRLCQALKEFNIIKNVWDVTKAGWSLLFPFPENKKNKKTKNMICIFLKKYDMMLYKNLKIRYVEITFQEQWQR